MSKPNIIFIMCDQLRADALGCYGNDVCRTPSVDRLAKDGLTFDRAYTTCPVCTPARASLQTGLFPSRHGLTSNQHDTLASVHELQDRPRLLSRQLARQDYSLGFIGKWHMGYGPRPNATEEEIGKCPALQIREEQSLPTLMGYEGLDFPGYGGVYGPGGDAYEAYLREHNLTYECPNTTPSDVRGGHTVWGEILSPVESSIDYFLIEKSIEQVDTFSKRGRPFFTQTHFWGPHAMATPPTAFLDELRDVKIEPWANFDDPLINKPRIHNMWRRRDLEWPAFAEFIRHYWAFMTHIDAQIGRLLDHLQELGLYEDAWIIFTADHGDSQGCHAGIENKSGNLYEETARIPLIIKPPSSYDVAGQRTNALAGICDLHATILDLAGAEAQDGDGESLLQVVRNPQTQDWRDFVVCEGAGLAGIGTTQKMIRHGDTKYVFNAGDMDELYDLASDPHELTNLVFHPDRADTLLAMRRRLSQWMADHHSPGPSRTFFERIVGLQ